MTDKISKKDKKDWENFLSNTEKLQDKELNTHIEKIISFSASSFAIAHTFKGDINKFNDSEIKNFMNKNVC